MRLGRLLGITAVLLAAMYWLAFQPRARRGVEVEIVGSARFTDQVRQALQLLRTRDPEAYGIVTNYVGRIKQGQRSGMWVTQIPPTFEMSSDTAFYSVTWCAATIAHDSFHSKLYNDARQAGRRELTNAWTGTEAEKLCMQHQLAVMERIGTPKSEIEYGKGQADGHYVKDQESWLDYSNRNW